MTPIEIEDLPAAATDVLQRRSRAAGLSVQEYVRAELIALTGRRVPLDAVVEFLAEERSGHTRPEVDAGGPAVLGVYGLPADARNVLTARAAAAGRPVGEYVRQELIALARRGTIDDAIVEIREAVERVPGMVVDMDAVAASVRYARGL